MPKQHIITKTSPYSSKTHESKPLTLEEAIAYYGYTLNCGNIRQGIKGNKKVNLSPRTIGSLITNLNNAAYNIFNNCCSDSYTAREFVAQNRE